MESRMSVDHPENIPFMSRFQDMWRSQRIPLALVDLLARCQPAGDVFLLRTWLKAEKEYRQWGLLAIPAGDILLCILLCAASTAQLWRAPGLRRLGSTLEVTESSNPRSEVENRSMWHAAVTRETGVCSWCFGKQSFPPHAKRKVEMVVHLVSLCSGVHGILNKEYHVLMEQRYKVFIWGKKKKSQSRGKKSKVRVCHCSVPMRCLNRLVPSGKCQYLGTHIAVSQSTVNLGFYGVSVLLPMQLRVNFGSGYIHRQQAAACLIQRRIPFHFIKFCLNWDIWIWYSNT